MTIKRTSFVLLLLLSGIVGLLNVSCSHKTLDGMLILTRTSDKTTVDNLITGESWRYILSSQIVAVDPDNPKSVRILTEGMYAACSPAISSDGLSMIFAAKQTPDDNWQIWEMDLRKLKSRKITSFTENCTDPVFLPNGRVVFSKYLMQDEVNSGHGLFSCNIDGTDIRQLTFHPHINFATSVLQDGRLLTITRQLLPKVEDPMYMILRPDGTKADMFYKGGMGSTLLSRPHETNEGKIWFVEADSARSKGNVVSISYNRPLHSRIVYTTGIQGSCNAVLPAPSGQLWVSFKPSDAEHYSIYTFDPESKKFGNLVYDDPGYDIIDMVRVAKVNPPKKLPSEVDLGVKTGLVMCQDINKVNSALDYHGSQYHKASRIEILGIDSTLGIVEVEDDGSFYLKVSADMPFQIRTLDDNGRTVNGPSAWMWLRPNERRGCVGCHEDPELVPENNVPQAVKKDPVIIPVHVSEILEKEVELE